MVNITYDACKCCLPCYVYMSHFVQTAGSIQAWDDENQVPIIYNNGDIAWTLASTALVWIMIPGVGFFYSGLLRRKNALSMIYLSMMTVAVVSFQVRSRRSPNPYITR
jgi:hypothetical protein